MGDEMVNIIITVTQVCEVRVLTGFMELYSCVMSSLCITERGISLLHCVWEGWLVSYGRQSVNFILITHES